MIRFSNNNKGAISVFLVIVLLPMMIFSWILIDSARVKLAYSRVVAATDMTMNASLSNYDGILKDMYGLFAVSQSKSDLMENLDEYFIKNLMIAGLDEEAAGYLNENVIHKVLELGSTTDNSAPYADLISPEIDKFIIGLYPGSSLANPRMMKDQVINFMKYRAPLGVGLELLESLKNFETVDKQSAVVENKTKYYESQASLEEHLRKSWAAIERYQELHQGAVDKAPLSAQNIEAMVQYFTANGSDQSECYKDIFENVRKALFYELLITKPSTYGVSPGPFSVDKRKIYLEPVNWDYQYLGKLDFTLEKQGEIYTFTTGNRTIVIDFTDIDKAETTEKDSVPESEPIYRYIYGNGTNDRGTEATYNKYRNGLFEYNDNFLGNIFYSGRDVNDILKYGNGSGSFAEINSIAAYIARSIEKMGITDVGSDLYNNFFEPLKAALDYQPQETEESKTNEADDQDKQEKNDEEDQTKKIYFTKDEIDNYKNFMRFLVQLSDFNSQREFKYATTEYEKDIKPHLNKIYTFWNALNNAKSYLNTAKTEIESAITVLNGDLKTNRENWKTSSNDLKSTSFGKSNLEEADQIEKKFDEAEMRKLIGILEKKIATVESMLQQMNEITFCEKPIHELSSIYSFYELFVANYTFDLSKYKDYKTVSIDHDDDLRYNLSVQFKNISEGTGNGHFGHLKYKPADSDSTIPFVSPGKMYNYMSKVYKGASKTSEASSETQDSQKDEAKNTNTDLAKGNPDGLKEANKAEKPYKTPSAKGVFTEDEGYPSKINLQQMDADKEKTEESETKDSIKKFDDKFGTIQGDDWDASAKSVHGNGSQAQGFFKPILEALSNGLENLRDILYLEEYIMGMFSYQTIEKEIFTEKYKDQIGDSFITQLMYSNFSLYTEDGKLRETGFGADGIEIDTAARDEILEQIETLTNISIKPDFNAQYLNEVEYIIYGESGSSGVEGTIFGIRFLLNTISAFMNSELTSLARSIATAIFGTPPLTFLMPIAMIAIIIACAIGESTIDKQLIMGGFSVPVFKTKDNWILTPSGLAKEGTKAAANVAGKVIKTGIDKAYTAINGFIDDLDKKANDAIDNMSEEAKNEANQLTDEAVNKLGDVLDTAYDDTIGSYVDAVTENLTTLVDTHIQVEYLMAEGESISADKIIQKVKEELEDQVGLSVLNKDGLEYKVKKAAVDFIISKGDQYIRPLVEVMDVSNKARDNYTLMSGEKINSTSTNPLVAIPNQIREAVLGSINGTIKDASGNIKKYTGELIGNAATGIKSIKNTAVNNVKNAAKNGKEELKKAADNFIDGLTEKIPGTDGTALSSEKGKAFSLGYSGYLRIFLIIALLANTDDVMKRMGDIIQINIKKQNQSFKLSSSYCYVELSSETRIEPLFFSFNGLNRFLGYKDGEGLGIEKMYKIQYSERSGY